MAAVKVTSNLRCECPASAFTGFQLPALTQSPGLRALMAAKQSSFEMRAWMLPFPAHAERQNGATFFPPGFLST